MTWDGIVEWAVFVWGFGVIGHLWRMESHLQEAKWDLWRIKNELERRGRERQPSQPETK